MGPRAGRVPHRADSAGAGPLRANPDHAQALPGPGHEAGAPEGRPLPERYSGKNGAASGTSRLLSRAAAVSSQHVPRRAGGPEQAARSWAAGVAAAGGGRGCQVC